MIKKLNRYADIIAGGLAVLISIVVLIASAAIKQRVTTGAIGPRTVPVIVALLLMAVGIMTLIKGVRDIRRGQGARGTMPENKLEALPVLATLLALVVYLVIMKSIGFMLSSFLYLMVQFAILDVDWRKCIVRNLIVAVVVSGTTYLLFSRVFLLSLPKGILF